MSTRFQLLAPAGEVLVSSYVGAGQYIFQVPAEAGSVGSPAPRAFRLYFAVDKATSINPASDYLKLDTSPDDGATWFNLPLDESASDAFNFLTGKSGTSIKFETVVWLLPGTSARLRANAGLTLTKVGIPY